jgi:hypothetical protein
VVLVVAVVVLTPAVVVLAVVAQRYKVMMVGTVTGQPRKPELVAVVVPEQLVQPQRQIPAEMAA